MARPRQFDEAEVKVALRNVFWQHGYDGTSYADIIAATGLNKGSLYASFGDKRALYQHAIASYDREFISGAVKMMRNENLSPEDRLKTLFKSLISAAQTPQGRWGCLLCNAAVEQSSVNEDVETSVSEALSRLRSAIKFCVKDTRAAERVELIWTAYFGGHVMVKAGYSKAVLRAHQKQVLSLLT